MRNLYTDDKVNYIRSLFAKEDKLLLQIREEAIGIGRPININPEEGKLLQLIMQLGNCKKILEIGTFYGYSTIWLARSVDDIEIYTIEKDKAVIEKARQNFILAGLNNRIKIIEGEAEKVLLTLEEKFDAVFIDAEKNHYLEYLNLVERIIKKGGLIIADNSLLSGAVYKEELPYRIRESTKNKMQEFNKRLSDCDKYTSILIPSDDGIIVAIKNF